MHAVTLTGLSGCGGNTFDIFLSVKLATGPLEPDVFVGCAAIVNGAVGKSEISLLVTPESHSSTSLL